MNRKATIKIGALFTILLIICVFYGYKSLNSFLLFNKLDNLKMISSDKKVSDGIYFIQGKIYSESVKKTKHFLLMAMLL